MRFVLSAAAVSALVSSAFAGSVVQSVTQYNPGTLPGTLDGYTVTSAAIGAPSASNDYGAITPFNAPYLPSEVLGIGQGGSAVMQFDQPVLVGPGAKIGVFSNTTLVDWDPDTVYNSLPPYDTLAGGRGYTGTSGQFLNFGGGIANVSVSADGQTFVALGLTTFSNPTNGYTDNTIALSQASIGQQRADYFKPFEKGLGDLVDLWYSDPSTDADLLRVLDGSAGGTWLDVSGSGLSQIAYVRFDVPEGGRLVVDAVTAVPEPATAGMLSAAALLLLRRRRPTTRGTTN